MYNFFLEAYTRVYKFYVEGAAIMQWHIYMEYVYSKTMNSSKPYLFRGFIKLFCSYAGISCLMLYSDAYGNLSHFVNNGTTKKLTF